MASGKTLAVFDALASRAPETGFASIDFSGDFPVVDFDDTAVEATSFLFVLPSDYAGGGFRVRLTWAATSATTGGVEWSCRADRFTPDGAPLDAGASGVGRTAVGAPASALGVLASLAIDLSHSDAEGPAAGDVIRLEVCRKAASASDTMVGDAELVGLEVMEA